MPNTVPATDPREEGALLDLAFLLLAQALLALTHPPQEATDD